MKDFTKEILAYALDNAIEFGKADASKILPKLFQHGLEKKEISSTIPLIKEITERVNSMELKERAKEFAKLQKIVKKNEEEKDKDLPEIDVSELKEVVTRIAPEPSKYSHLGHALSFLLNYLYAKKYGGECLLRFEDTNPEKVSQEYVDAFLEDLKDYLGIKYDKIKYVSDDMQKLYGYAEELVKNGHAYICHCPQEEVRDNRAKGVECGCRQFPLGIQILRWKEFLDGKYAEGHAVLRLKGNMQSQNFVMRDPILFRRLDAKHYRHGTKYKIWPMYDFYNPIEDSLMGVTLILRSNEFDLRVELQDYIKDLLKLKKQRIIQYGRFNVKEFTTKGREIRELIESGNLIGWDDPRLITLKALRRRGIAKEAFYELAKQVGLSKHPVNLEFDMIAAINRKILDKKTMRYFFVDNAVKIEIENAKGLKDIEIPVHPDTPEKTRKVKVADRIFISGKDFNDLKGQEVRLLHLFNLVLNEKTKISSVENKKIPKIQWVCNGIKVKVLMPSGEWVDGFAEKAIEKLKVGEVVQFERFGFVRFDRKNKDAYEFWFGHK